MRLICPNCGAQYDVPVEVIPDGGRDVQCSNCGHTWFQRHPDQDVELAEDLNLPVPDPEWTPEDEDAEEEQPSAIPPAERPRVAPRTRPAPAPEPPEPERADAPDEDGQDAEIEAEQDAPKPRGLDPEVAEIFREERDYEAKRRAVETLETQPDLGLQEPDEDERARRSRQARERMARIRGEETVVTPRPAPRRPAFPQEAEADENADDKGRANAEAAAAAAAASSRRDLLPDVDEINQTLRSTSEPRVIDAAERSSAPVQQEKSGFGKGFVLIIVLAALAIATYFYAPNLKQAVPDAAPYLDAYVAKVDALRLWLDGQITNLLSGLDGMSSETGDADTPAPMEDGSAPVGE